MKPYMDVCVRDPRAPERGEDSLAHMDLNPQQMAAVLDAVIEAAGLKVQLLPASDNLPHPTLFIWKPKA